MKIAVIGGGGVRSMFLAKSLAQSSEELGFDEIVFMDNDEHKLNIYGKMAAQLVKKLRPELNFKLTRDPVEAVKDADYIIELGPGGGMAGGSLLVAGTPEDMMNAEGSVTGEYLKASL